MQSRFGVTQAAPKPKLDRQQIRIKQRFEALRKINTTGKCHGVVPWPLTQPTEGYGPDSRICQPCDIYLECPLLDKMIRSVKLEGNASGRQL